MWQAPGFWYQRTPCWQAQLLRPCAWVYAGVSRLRALLYRFRLLSSYRAPVPVIVVGNITVGGTGKTPLVIALANYLQAQGWRPGIISRGYGGVSSDKPRLVTSDSSPAVCGDEAVLIAKHTGLPVVVHRSRAMAARYLLEQFACTVILSDDGLQHAALERDLEIVVIDGERRFGNGLCLPAGPLREPVARLHSVDWVITNGGTAAVGEVPMTLLPEELRALQGSERRPLTSLRDQTVYAVAGIGNPERFFDTLRTAGIKVFSIPFADHHSFSAQDLHFTEQLPIIMTEKDAVKCISFAQSNWWYLPISAQLPAKFLAALNQRLLQLRVNA
jgi:tetraacyldisaccharide 4'-kinase